MVIKGFNQKVQRVIKKIRIKIETEEIELFSSLLYFLGKDFIWLTLRKNLITQEWRGSINIILIL